ncbi:MAG: ACT domain-containing protein [Bryobacteraceae bacterium]
MSLVLRLLHGELAIFQLPPDAASLPWLSFSARPLVSVTRTAHELSVVCPLSEVPDGMACEPGWRAFVVEGKQDFSAVGILSSILSPLAGAGISIFSISTFDTDYILVRIEVLEKARTVLRKHFQLLEA